MAAQVMITFQTMPIMLQLMAESAMILFTLTAQTEIAI